MKRIMHLAEKLGQVTIMEICGGHTNVILKHGIRELLPENIRLISGPGCPVCVSSQHDIDSIIELAENDIPIATYGDMMRVPGSQHNLEEMKAQGHPVFEVYSTTEVLSLRKKYPDIIFFGVGFETTAPMSAYLLKNGITVYSVHKLVPPAIDVLASEVDGFINPGHVSTIIGSGAYRDVAPQAIAGFTPELVLVAIEILLELLVKKRKNVVNAYPQAVTKEGNPRAKEIMAKYFSVKDSEWRGLGIICRSGLEVRDDKLNAKIKYNKLLLHIKPKKTACRCSEVLRGLEPHKCPLYGKECTPETPVGACMVSSEGSCQIHYSYEK